MLAVTYPWASASSYLSSQSVTSFGTLNASAISSLSCPGPTISESRPNQRDPHKGAAPRGHQHGSQTRCRSFRQGASIILLAAPKDPPRFCRRLRALNPSGPKPLLPREIA